MGHFLSLIILVQIAVHQPAHEANLSATAKGVAAMKESNGSLPDSVSLPVPDPSMFKELWFPTNMPIPSALRAFVNVIGDDLGLEYEVPLGKKSMDIRHMHFMGVSGEAFTFLWFPKGGKRLPYHTSLYGEDPARTFRLGLAAAGFPCETHVRQGFPVDTELSTPLDLSVKESVVRCLAERKLPVIATGIPEPDNFMIVTGYAKGGNVIEGWHGRPGGGGMRFKPDNKVSVDVWLDNAHLLIVPGGRGTVPSEREAVRNALVRAVELLRMTESGESHAGPAVFQVWADAFLSDNPPELGPPEKKQSVEDRYRWLVCPMTWEMMERTTYAAVFLARACEIFPDAKDELTAARDCLNAVDEAMQGIGKLFGGGKTPYEGWDGVRDPALRKQAAKELAACDEKWLEAADHLEKAVAILAK